MKFRDWISLNEAELSPEMSELELYIDNDRDLYRQRYIPILKNYTKKMRKGMYDRKLAAKGFMHLVDAGAKKYVKEFGSPGDKVQNMFPKKEREKLAMAYAIDFENKYKNQEYDFMKEEYEEEDEKKYLTKQQRSKLPKKIKKEIIKKKKKKKMNEGLDEANRPLWQIAKEIKKDWKKVNYAARPYLDAMMQLDDINDMFMMDSARSVVAYFLSNASGWRGPIAKKIKAELKSMLKK